VSVKATRFLFRSAATAGILSAAALVASAVPASAAPFASLTGFGGTEEFTCAVTTHGIRVDPLTSANNGCANRLWLHQFHDGSGWAYCISGHAANQPIPARFHAAEQAQVVSNTAHC
jgi:hypothetical protein